MFGDLENITFYFDFFHEKKLLTKTILYIFVRESSMPALVIMWTN